MVYVITNKTNKSWMLLVKAPTREFVEERLNLTENEEITTTLTDSEISVLEMAHFAVIKP